MLDLGKASCNGKAKTASLRIAGMVSPYKTLSQLFRRNGQFCARNIFDGNLRFFIAVFYDNINPRGWKRLFNDICIQIFKYSESFLRI